MKKIIIFLLLVGVQSQASAEDCPSERYMLHWKYGSVFGYKGGNITYWNHTSISQAQAEADKDSNMIDCKKGYTQVEKIAEIKAEGLRRIQVYLPGIKDFDEFQLIKEFWLSIAPAARQATAPFQETIDIYQAGAAAVGVLNNYTGYSSISNYNPLTNYTSQWP